MTLTPQLPPTDFAELEKIEDRDEREQQYAEQQIYTEHMPQGTRFTKGTDPSTPRSWQSLDVVLHSDASSAAALPTRQLRRSRLFAALTVAAGILTIAGAAASAREGLNLGDIDPAGGVLLGGGLATVGFAITSGVFFGKSRQGYERAVDVYNDSLGMRLGLLDGEGNYLPPRGALVDADGNVVLDPGVDERPVTIPTPVESAPVPAAQPPVAEPAAVAPAEPAEDPAADTTAAPTPEAELGTEAPAEPTPEVPAAEAAPADPGSEPTVATPEPGPSTAALQLQPRI
ncbi:MAG: hypothetical protein ACRBN8_00060 [Nannocystales bacterium]